MFEKLDTGGVLMQVANYCRDRIHVALAEEIGSITGDLCDAINVENRQVQWEKTFTSCFLKVDDEVGGKVSRGKVGGSTDASDSSFYPIAPETVGSTAVVALVCSSHIIVANCGDSRAILCRGKESMTLSIDHKVIYAYKVFNLILLRTRAIGYPFVEINLFFFIIVQPSREDEYARIEASGGKVIQWNGHRVFGVLAMSRSIGSFSSFLA